MIRFDIIHYPIPNPSGGVQCLDCDSELPVEARQALLIGARVVDVAGLHQAWLPVQTGDEYDVSGIPCTHPKALIQSQTDLEEIALIQEERNDEEVVVIPRRTEEEKMATRLAFQNWAAMRTLTRPEGLNPDVS